MKKTGVMSWTKGMLATLVGARKIGDLDLAVLRTMMMLAAVDGDVSAAELDAFKTFAEGCRGYSKRTFAKVWDAALRSAGVLVLKARILPKVELVQAFLSEAAPDLIKGLSESSAVVRGAVFAKLEALAESDGKKSEIEAACIAALHDKVCRTFTLGKALSGAKG